MLLEAAAPVPDFSRQSFGINSRLEYFEASQRASLRAVFFFDVLSLELDVVPELPVSALFDVALPAVEPSPDIELPELIELPFADEEDGPP